MYDSIQIFKRQNKRESSEQVQDKRDQTIELLKKQVLELNDKFDYFVCMMLKSNQLPVDSLAEMKLSPKARKRNKTLNFSDASVEEDKAETLSKFKSFTQNAS